MKLNILYVTHEQNLGGASRSLIALIDEMIEFGNEVYVLVSLPLGEVHEELKKRKVKIIYSRYYFWMYSENNLHSLKTKVKRLINNLSAIILAQKIRNLDIDIVHTNSSVVDIGLKLSGFLKKKHVFHFREFGLEDQNLHFCDGFEKSIKYIDKYSDKIIFISNNLSAKFSSYFSYNKIAIIHNGISKEYIQLKETRSVENIQFLISGTITPNKGHREAVEALKVLIDKGYKNIKLIIAGTGNELFIQDLQLFISENYLENYINFVGRTSNINELRKITDIELVCSKREAFGRISIEAMMSTNPVIASNTGANPEIVKNNINGLLYEQGNSRDLASKMEFFIQSPEEINKIGEEAFRYSLSNFTATINAQKIQEVYQELLKK
jgi:L-malate glycosyltransferase